MSKIDEYNVIKKTGEKVKANILKALGEDRADNDKARLEIRYANEHKDWNDAKFWLHASYGYYGSSSGYSAMDRDTARYFERAINLHIKDIAKTIFKLVDEDIKKAAQEAKEEAEAVLKVLETLE